MSFIEADVIEWTNCIFGEINPRKVSGTPIHKGSRIPADDSLENYLGGPPIEEIAGNFELPEAAICNMLLFAAKQNPAIRL